MNVFQYTKSICSWHDFHLFLPHWTFVYCPQKNESISGFLAAGRRSNASQRNDVSHSVWNWLKRIIFVSCRKIIEKFVEFKDTILLIFNFWVKNETFLWFWNTMKEAEKAKSHVTVDYWIYLAAKKIFSQRYLKVCLAI